MFTKKTLKGFKTKPKMARQKSEVDDDYTRHAFQAGHKARIVSQLQREIEDHITYLEVLSGELASLPKTETKKEVTQ